MANQLTGDFDVVMEFAIPAANRVLAAMHRIERFPHSLALSVDDTQRGPKVPYPSVVGVVDTYGDPTADHRHIAPPADLLGTLAGSGAIRASLDSVVNAGLAGFEVPPIVPSHLKGRAQLQVSPPTIEVADASGSGVRVRMMLMSRYFPDPGTAKLAEFVRGELQLTAAIDHVATQVANIVEIDVKADSVGITFTPFWSSAPVSAEDLAAITLLIRNAYKTGVLPTNSTLPPGVSAVQFKTLAGGQPALAMLLNMGSGTGSPATAQTVFLGAGDDFAVGIGADFVKRTLEPIRTQILSTPIASVTIPVDTWLYTFHVEYTITLNTASIDLEAGKIVLTLTGHAHTSRSWMPDFDFTVRQEFTLEPDGATANLVVGQLSIDTSSWVVNLFRGAAAGAMTSARDQALAQSGAYPTVRSTLDANTTLGSLLDSLLTPGRGKVVPLPHQAALAYTTIDISPDGITLHGSLAVPSWPTPHVEFEQIPANPDGVHDVNVVSTGPDYTALKTWIPGGAVQRYEWSSLGQTQPSYVDENRFVLLHQGLVVSAGMARLNPMPGYTPLCLTARGTRLSPSGPIVAESVAASVCGISTFPIVDGARAAMLADDLPQMTLTHPGPQGLEVIGHAGVEAGAPGTPRPNLVVHFSDTAAAEQLDQIVRTLGKLENADASAAVLAIVAADYVAGAAHVPGVIYSTDKRSTWERLFDTTVRGAVETLLIAPDGKIVWRHAGTLDEAALLGALKTSLVPIRGVPTRIVASEARLGHVPPNFLFEYSPGRQLTLRKLAGRPAHVVFWRSTSRPSIAAVRDAAAADDGHVILAVNDGENADRARRVASEEGLAATIVADPARAIARAYGVTVWPTTIVVDGLGVVSSVQYGRETMQGGGRLEDRAPNGGKR